MGQDRLLLRFMQGFYPNCTGRDKKDNWKNIVNFEIGPEIHFETLLHNDQWSDFFNEIATRLCCFTKNAIEIAKKGTKKEWCRPSDQYHKNNCLRHLNVVTSISTCSVM